MPLLIKKGHQVIPANYPEFNLLDQKSVTKAVGDQTIDVVIHLAGMSHVVECENNKDQAFRINVEGTKNLLSAVLELNRPVHFIFASTAQVYKAPTADETNVTFTEDRPIQPQNYYASTKLEAEKAILEATQNPNLTATILRLFNHSHKSQAPTFFLPHLYQQLASGETKIPVGNLDLARDIGSIRDLVKAIAKVVDQNDWQLEIFNICSGRGKNLRTLANLLAKKMNVKADFVVDPKRVRPGEPQTLIGSHQKLSGRIDWKPAIISEEQLVDDFLCE